MLGPLAIAVPLLAILSDDDDPEEVDLVERVRRSLAFDNWAIALRGLPFDEVLELLAWVEAHIASGEIDKETRGSFAQGILSGDQEMDFLNFLDVWTDEAKDLDDLMARVRVKMLFYGEDPEREVPAYHCLPTFGGVDIVSQDEATSCEEGDEEGYERLRENLNLLKDKEVDVIDLTAFPPSEEILSFDEKRVLVGGNLDNYEYPYLAIIERPSRKKLEQWRKKSIEIIKEMG